MKHGKYLVAALLSLLVCISLAAAAEVDLTAPRNPGWVNALKPKGPPGPELLLATNHTTTYTILESSQPTTQDEKAALDLAQYLQEMTGATFPIAQEGTPGAAPGPFLSVGHTDLLAHANLAAAKFNLGKEGYAIAAQGQNLFLLGGSLRGPINAVYALLEEDLGCRWYARGSASIPQVSELKFRPVLRSFVPVLELRDPFYWDAFDSTWSLRNRTSTPSAPIPAEWGGNASWPYGWQSHSVARLVDADTYFKSHPEYFSEINGVRTPGQLCLTNPDVLRISIEGVKKVLRANPGVRFLSVAQNDGFPLCECPVCGAVTAAQGSKSGPLLNYVNQIADAIAPEFPNVTLTTLAYLDTFAPPKTIKPRPNVVIYLATDSHAWSHPFLTVDETQKFQTALKGWAALGAHIFIWDYTTNFANFLLPIPDLPIVAPDMRFYIAHNVKGIMLEGAYEGPGGSDAPLKSWVWAQQMWDPSLDTQALVRDFDYGYYGAAAEPMQQYQDLLWKTWQANRHGSLRDCGIGYDATLPIFTPAFLQQSNGLMNQAKALSQDPETLRRVEVASLALMYVQLDQDLAVMLKGGKVADPQACIARLDAFEKLADREKVVFLSEGAPNTDDWIARFRHLLSTDPTAATQFPATTPSGPVQVVRLPAQWKLGMDPHDVGVAQGWFAPAWNDQAWSLARTDMNCGWEAQGYDGDKALGHGWYRQRLPVPAEMTQKHLYLYFGAADEDAWVYVDGKLALDHSCQATGLRPDQIWTTPFFLDAAPYLKAGATSVVAVRVNNTAGMGGLWKPVYLIGSDAELDLAAIQQAAQQEPPAK